VSALEHPHPLVVRLAVAITGASSLGAGGAAVFLTDNGTGSAALVTLGGILLLASGLWDRLDSVEFAGTKLQLQLVERLRDRAVVAEAEGNQAVAAALREEAQNLLEEARPHAAAYERLRDSLAPGFERTRKLEEMVANARTAARQSKHDPAKVRQLFDTGTDGNRIFALGLMEEDEDLRDFNSSLTAIEHSRSAFEQYHALHLAELMLSTLSGDQREQLKTTLTEHPGNATYIQPGTDRWIVAQRIMSRL
jgi:hypothetical protein